MKEVSSINGSSHVDRTGHNWRHQSITSNVGQKGDGKHTPNLSVNQVIIIINHSSSSYGGTDGGRDYSHSTQVGLEGFIVRSGQDGTGQNISGHRTGTGRKDTSSGFLVGNHVAWKGRLHRSPSEPEEIMNRSERKRTCFASGRMGRNHLVCVHGRSGTQPNSNELKQVVNFTNREQKQDLRTEGRRRVRDLGGRAGWQPSFLRSVESPQFRKSFSLHFVRGGAVAGSFSHLVVSPSIIVRDFIRLIARSGHSHIT